VREKGHMIQVWATHLNEIILDDDDGEINHLRRVGITATPPTKQGVQSRAD
jgi:hypothetical protein